MEKVKSVCIFCGSRSGNDPSYAENAKALAKALADKGLTLVYGAGDRGIMGAIARTFKEKGCKAIGIDCRRFVDDSVKLPFQLDEYVIAQTMQERKATMLEKADAFIALPGGMGTLDELTEAVNMTQIGWLDKPMVVFNPNGFYDSLKALLDNMQQAGFYTGCSNLYFAPDVMAVVDILGLGDD